MGKVTGEKKELGFYCDRLGGSRHGAHKSERLWACSGELLRQPLLKNLMHNAELSNLACNAFTDIRELAPIILHITYSEIHHLTPFWSVDF